MLFLPQAVLEGEHCQASNSVSQRKTPKTRKEINGASYAKHKDSTAERRRDKRLFTAYRRIEGTTVLFLQIKKDEQLLKRTQWLENCCQSFRRSLFMFRKCAVQRGVHQQKRTFCTPSAKIPIYTVM